MSTNKKGTSFRLSDATRGKLDTLSKRLNCSQAQVVETAVTIYMELITQSIEEFDATTKRRGRPKKEQAE